ncbi:hypothetical protein M422DRAFT_262591 [Sphaerobolus stellatus SS14]|uniref:Uncharacterized protein n=1 Tax=Sphaerobolus stellatus (strain SS14) TaxID=990650 RepID=A0A0C9VCF6_SPHS4|nr:hypothetical protein M422DRAFT_262591 [Sphaerobolus stellatus SS14]
MASSPSATPARSSSRASSSGPSRPEEEFSPTSKKALEQCNMTTLTSASLMVTGSHPAITPVSRTSTHPTHPSSSLVLGSDVISSRPMFRRNDSDSDNETGGSPSRSGSHKMNVEQSLTFLRGQKRMPDESETDLMIWIGLKDDREARRGREYAAILQLRDELREAGLIGKKKVFEISQDLSVEIKSYSWMVALSPALPSYRGGTPPTIVWLVDFLSSAIWPRTAMDR